MYRKMEKIISQTLNNLLKFPSYESNFPFTEISEKLRIIKNWYVTKACIFEIRSCSYAFQVLELGTFWLVSDLTTWEVTKPTFMLVCSLDAACLSVFYLR